MTDAFAPLVVPATLPSTQGTVFRLKVIPESGSSPAFKPLQAALGPATPAAPVAHSLESPRVTLQRDGDRVTHIRVECACGEVFELACAY